MNMTNEQLQEAIDDMIEGISVHRKPIVDDRLNKSQRIIRTPETDEGEFDMEPDTYLTDYLRKYKLYEKYHEQLPKKIAEELLARGEFTFDEHYYHMVIVHSQSGKEKIISIRRLSVFDINISDVQRMDQIFAQEAISEMEARLQSGLVPENQMSIFTKIYDKLKRFLQCRLE